MLKFWAFGVFLLLNSGTALADAIDGDWCNKIGKHLRIDGPTIKIPGGTIMKGEYDLHGFMYTVRKGNPGGGQKVVMDVQDDENMVMKVGTSGPEKLWKRCPISVS